MRGPGWRRLLAAGLGTVLVGLGGPWVVTAVGSAGRVHSSEEYAGRPADERAEVALVLGASVHPDGRPSRYLRARLDRAVELYRAGAVRAILVSGDGSTTTHHEPSVMKKYLVEAGIPPRQIVTDEAGFDTYDSCVRAREVYGVRRVVIVSQGYHLPRAVTTCRLVGVDADGVGDWTVRRIGPLDGVPVLWRLGWSRFAVRELPANIKMLWDVGSRRTPTLGAQDPGVQEALAR